MKRSKIILAILGVALVILISAGVGRKKENVFYSDAEISVNNIQNTEQSPKVIWIEPNYYFYDAEEQGIVSYSESGEKEKVLGTTDIIGLTGNKESLFYIDGKNLYQYSFKDKTVKNVYLSSTINYDMEICVGEHNLYLYGDGFLKIFSANNIQEKVNISINKNDMEQIMTFCENGIVFEIFAPVKEKEHLILCLNYPEQLRKGAFHIKETDTYTSIYSSNGELNISAMLVEDDTGYKMIGDTSLCGRVNNQIVRFEEGIDIYYDLGVQEIENNEVTYGSFGADYAIKNIAIDENMVIGSAASYQNSSLTLEDGPLSEHESDNIWYVDLEQKSSWKNYCFDKGEIVWYADKEKYILFHEGEMITYDAETQEEICRKTAEWFDADDSNLYEVVLCRNKWFVFKDNTMIDVISMEQYLN